MTAALLLVALLCAAPPPEPPLELPQQRTGVRLGQRRVLKLEWSTGVLLDSNPTNASFSDYARLRQREIRVASPSVGLSLGPSVTLRQERARSTLSLRAGARAWGQLYVAPVFPEALSSRGMTPPPHNLWPNTRAALDANVDGTFTWNARRGGVLTSSVALLRTNVPTPEQLGVLTGRTTLLLSQAWERSNPRKNLTLSADAGARGDAFDDVTLQLTKIRVDRPSTWPVYVGGGGFFMGASLTHRWNARHEFFARGQLGTALYLTGTRVLSFSVPALMMVGWRFQPQATMTLRVEGGVWVPDSVCPNPVWSSCTSYRAQTVSGASFSVGAAQAWLPQPVGAAQWDQAVGRRWLFSARLSKEGRSTPLFAFVDEKRVHLSATGQLATRWQLRASTALAFLSYGAPVDDTVARNRVAWPERWPAIPWSTVGRQDLSTTADVTLRFTATPWLVLTAQQSALMILTTTETHRADGTWGNPGLMRSLTALSLLLQW